MSEARPESNSTKTVDDKCLPMLSAAKNMYRGFLIWPAYSSAI